jgi:FKBP-type peptidyl-prolyl cis-trans isomerase
MVVSPQLEVFMRFLPLLAGLVLLAACGSRDRSSRTGSAQSADFAVDTTVMTRTGSGLRYHDVAIGEGAEATPGHKVKVHYTGWLLDGKKFDSSRDHGEPFEFTLGAGQVIPGWDEGVAGMKVGGRRKLVIPADLGYGASGAPPDIPPGATLVFDVELLDTR